MPYGLSSPVKWLDCNVRWSVDLEIGDGHELGVVEGGLVVQDSHALGRHPLVLRLTAGVVPGNVVHQVPLLTVCGVAVDAVELLNSIMNFPM